MFGEALDAFYINLKKSQASYLALVLTIFLISHYFVSFEQNIYNKANSKKISNASASNTIKSFRNKITANSSKSFKDIMNEFEQMNNTEMNQEAQKKQQLLSGGTLLFKLLMMMCAIILVRVNVSTFYYKRAIGIKNIFRSIFLVIIKEIMELLFWIFLLICNILLFAVIIMLSASIYQNQNPIFILLIMFITLFTLIFLNFYIKIRISMINMAIIIDDLNLVDAVGKSIKISKNQFLKIAEAILFIFALTAFVFASAYTIKIFVNNIIWIYTKSIALTLTIFLNYIVLSYVFAKLSKLTELKEKKQIS